MANNSSIEWTQATWNPLAGCTAKSSGCLNCYAAVMTNRLGAMGQSKYKGLTVLQNGKRMFNGTIRLNDDALSIPLRRKKPTTYFVNSMSDLFWGDDDDLKTARRLGTENPQPVPFEFIDKVFAVMALCPKHTFQVLTKRPERAAQYLNENRENHRYIGYSANTVPPMPIRWPLPNLWLGTSCENQKAADERIPHLLRCPAAVRFISAEPLLGPIDFNALPDTKGDPSWDVSCLHGVRECIFGDTVSRESINKVSWVIVGGESGPGSRPFYVDWARSIISQCKEAGVACFVKQLGGKPILADVSDPHGWPTEGGSVNWETGAIRLKDRKGGDMAEWAEPLRVRQMPTGVPHAAQ